MGIQARNPNEEDEERSDAILGPIDEAFDGGLAGPLLTQVPLGRLGSPDDIAAAVAFLAGPEAAYITGETLHVNGGMYMI